MESFQRNPSGLKTTGLQSAPKQLYKVQPEIWLKDFLVDWGIIILTFVAYAALNSWLFLPVACLIIGSRQHALGLLGHEAAHRTAFKSRFLNDLFGDLFIAWPLCVDIKEGYRPWHFAHHRLIGTKDDPELSYRGLEPYRGEVTWGKIVRYFVTDMLGLGLLDLTRFMKAVFPYQKPVRYLGPIILWSCFLGITIALRAEWVFFLWALSLVTGFWAVFRVRTWTEHVAIDEKGREGSHRFHADPISRFLFFPHNTFCHYEHHKWSQVPYYHLVKLRPLDQTRSVLPLWGLFR